MIGKVMWLRFAQKMIEAQSSSGLGPPGGFRPYGFHLSDKFGGPRWWKYEYDGNCDQFIRNQYRYNPEYIPVGEAAEIKGSKWKFLFTLDPKELLGKELSDVNAYVIPERQESSMLMLHSKEDDTIRVIDLPDGVEVLDQIAKEPKAWKTVMIIEPEQGEIQAYAKRLVGDDGKGIFDINGKPSAPGWGYMWRDGPSPNPVNNNKGDMSDNLWDNWRQEVKYK